jgi:hypothetical protein
MENNIFLKLPDGSSILKKMFSEYNDDELKRVIKICSSISMVIDSLLLNKSYHSQIKKFISDNSIDTTHFIRRKREKIENKLIKGDKHIHSKAIKNYIIVNKIVENKCSVCNIEPIWNGKPLTLQLDHINGDHYDNRLENLRLICPNCHTQTDTFTGRNLRQYTVKSCLTCLAVLKSDNTTMKCAECISKEKHLCSICRSKEKYGKESRCKDCLKIEVDKIYCRFCKEQIKKNTNLEGYHKKCYKNNKIVKKI